MLRRKRVRFNHIVIWPSDYDKVRVGRESKVSAGIMRTVHGLQDRLRGNEGLGDADRESIVGPVDGP